MLTQELIRYKNPPRPKHPKGKQHVKAGSDEHRVAILEGTVKNIYGKLGWEPGTTVRTRHKPARDGVIIHIYEDINEVEWDDLKCKCVEVYFYTNDLELHHPSDLKEDK